MKKTIHITAIIIAIPFMLFSQEIKLGKFSSSCNIATAPNGDNESIFTIENLAVTKKEYVEISNKSIKGNKLALDNYLEQYMAFKLKVAYAYDLNYHHRPNLISELNGYVNQLKSKSNYNEILVREYQEGIIFYEVLKDSVWDKVNNLPVDIFKKIYSAQKKYQEKPFEDSKGYIIADLKVVYEEEWLNRLIKKYRITLFKDNYLYMINNYDNELNKIKLENKNDALSISKSNPPINPSTQNQSYKTENEVNYGSTLVIQSGIHPSTGEKFAALKKITSPSGKTYYIGHRKKKDFYEMLNEKGVRTNYPWFGEDFYNNPKFEWGYLDGDDLIKVSSIDDKRINFINLRLGITYDFVLLFKNPSSDGYFVIRDQADARWCSLGIIKTKDWHVIHPPGRNYLFIAYQVGNEYFKLYGISDYDGICSFGIKDNWTLLDKDGNYFMADKIYNKDGIFIKNSTKETYVSASTLELQATEIPFELQQKITALEYSDDIDGFLKTFKQQFGQFTMTYGIDALKTINSTVPSGTYIGQLYSGKPYGMGSWISDDKKFIYTGSWKDGKFNGKGHFRQTDFGLSNYSLTGNFANSIPSDKEMIVISPKLENEENTARDVIFYALAGSRRSYKFSISSWTDVGNRLIDRYSIVKSRNDADLKEEEERNANADYYENMKHPYIKSAGEWEIAHTNEEETKKYIVFDDDVSGHIHNRKGRYFIIINSLFGDRFYKDYESTLNALYVYEKYKYEIKRNKN